MFDFENALVSQIPLHEASRFFIGIKTAMPMPIAALAKTTKPKNLTELASGIRSKVPSVVHAPGSAIAPPPGWKPTTMSSHGLELQSKLRSEAERAAAA